MASQYGFGTTLRMPYNEVIPRVKEALKAEGFGVLTEIDVRQTLREKLGAEMEPYLILGACNPIPAHRALEVEPEIGLLLPCNVVIRVVEGAATSRSPIRRQCWILSAMSRSMPSPRKRNNVCSAPWPH